MAAHCRRKARPPTKVTGSLDRWGCWNAAWTVPTASAITQARKRLGRAVFPELFERGCGPVAGQPGPTAQARALALGLQLRSDAFVFSDAPDGSKFKIPSAVTHRYDRLAARLGIDTTLHKLRHYSATELILAGVDIRTVAGRLGHAGGGTTTLRT